MPRKEYFSSEEKHRFDTPPELSQSQRLIFIEIPKWAEVYAASLYTSTTRMGFLLQLGYFRIVTRFFSPSKFHTQDIDYIEKNLNEINQEKIDLTIYGESMTYYRHQKEILLGLGFTGFTSEHQLLLRKEADRLAYLQVKPIVILEKCVNYLQERRIEIPAYNTFRSILTEALDQFEKKLQVILNRYLLENDKLLLNELFKKKQLKNLGDSKYERYELTFFKRIAQSMRPSVIKARVQLFKVLEKHYQQLEPTIVKIKLSDTTIRYYAEYVLDSRNTNLFNRISNRYLLMISFVIYQYMNLGDALILTILNAVTASLNSAERRYKESLYQSTKSSVKLALQVTKQNTSHISALRKIEEITNDPELGDEHKIKEIKTVIQQKKINKNSLLEDQEKLEVFQTIHRKIEEIDHYYEMLEKESVHLQNKVSEIIQVLNFDKSSSQKDIYQAVNYYKEKGGVISQSSLLPIEFLSMAERPRIFSNEGKLKVSLYKVLLFKEVMYHIKAGSLNILSSYLYRAFEEYLIPKSKWMNDKDSFLKKAGLEHHSIARNTLLVLNEKLDKQFELLNLGLNKNEQVYFDKQDQWHLHRYKSQKEDTPVTALLYPQHKVISLLNVLRLVNKETGFMDAFRYKDMGYVPKKPDDRFFYAAIIGYGENIGIRKMGMISKNIMQNTLETVASHYFSPDSSIKANDMILKKSNQLPITNIFRSLSEFIHTGSDGQKFDVSVPSLIASSSYKYFGNGKGVTVYSHLDESGQLYFSTVFSAAERESAYVLDGLMHNEIINPDAHSTDSHGFSEVVAAVSGLTGLDFRPRLASIHKKQLYSINAVHTYKELGYKIVPDYRIDHQRTEEYWDEILRFICTIKLGYEKGSNLFRRLNSYSRLNPLHKALKDLGRIYSTLYILKYIDQPEISESVESIMSKVEHANKFAKAITLGNNQDFNWATNYEQHLAEGCKRLIMNAINYYNLLLLSEKIHACPSQKEKNELLLLIARSSTHTWQHINLQGEFDFTENEELPKFDMNAIQNLSL